MKLLTVALFAIAAQANVLPPWDYAPTLRTECDGWTLSQDCLPGVRVFFIFEPPYGLVPQTQQLPFTLWPAEQPIAPPVIAWESPHVEERPVVSAAPEPDLTWLAIAGLAGMLWIRRRG